MNYVHKDKVEKSFFYDFDNEYIWEIGLFKYGDKTWVEVSIGYLIALLRSFCTAAAFRSTFNTEAKRTR